MAKNRNRKKPKHRFPPAATTAAQPAKVPREGAPVDYRASHPIWSFAILDFYAEVGGWVHLSPDDRDQLLARFQRWEKMTWHEILAEGGKKNHLIDVDRCCDKSRERLEVRHLDDRDQLMSLSVTGKKRGIGILEGAVFSILWWDPGHDVCPSHMKHT
ncbi:MAG TPA: hypothetical protein VJA16_11310 [Thermoanaerobaculia bacterium]